MTYPVCAFQQYLSGDCLIGYAIGFVRRDSSGAVFGHMAKLQ